MSEQDKTVDDVKVINGVTVDVDGRDDSGYISAAHGATTPTITSKGFAQGCKFDNSTDDKVYINEGDETSCDFQVLVAGEVDASDLGTDSVNTDEIATDAVDSDEIAAGAVGSSEIDDGSVKSSDLHPDAKKQTEVLELSQLPAPTGSDQLDNDLFAITVPHNATIQGASIISDTATSGSDATNNYGFELVNQTAANSLSTAQAKTDTAELAAETPYALTVDQNQDVSGGDVLLVRVDILDDVGAGPTDLSTANIKLQLDWVLRD